MNAIAELLKQRKIESAQTFGGLTMFPLTSANSSAPNYLTLDDALERKLAHVTEITEGGSVPELRFENPSDSRILLVDGEELVGARQNRVLNITILVGSQQQIVIPVSCVERGRWAYVSREFHSARRKLFARARAAKMEQVSRFLRDDGSRRSDQMRVWADVADKSAFLSVRSRTDSMGDIYETQRASLERYERAFEPVANQTGGVFAISGKIVGIESFDATETLKKLMAKLISSYALDAMEISDQTAAAPSIDKVANFLKRVQEAALAKFPALGEGEDLRLVAEDLAGGALSVDDQVVHLAAFATNSSGSDG